MENYQKAARAHFALCCLYVVAAIAVGLAAALSETSSPAVMWVMVAVVLGMATVHFFLGRGADNRHPAAKVLSIIAGVMLLPGFPLGTLIGAYLIWNSATEWREPRKYGPGLADGWPTGQPVAPVSPGA